ncbi:hypothetical protein Herbaro_09530 [Herbaspirillum sp. WKF16]|uniref:hypothetical protein n=1 Tax=Herbaspirillum sp. WKF16 TaxID=3028312 RepID=UPI0023A940E7|nr:hypothetical protein [Herbaspirillum sp. WKF16]WDZ98001.1 hypothetical protein Herbaro_09530 [Herbaspirillum sp. WKF16]
MTWAAIKGLLGIVPSWCYWILLLAALCLGCELHGAGRIQKKWDLQVQQQKDANDAAIQLRREQNRAIGAEQALVSANIQKGHDDEMAQVRADLRKPKRLRLGPQWCGAGAAGAAQASGAAGSDAAGAGGRVLSPELDAAVKSLINQAEDAAGTARAAQAFIRQNGMAPP